MSIGEFYFTTCANTDDDGIHIATGMVSHTHFVDEKGNPSTGPMGEPAEEWYHFSGALASRTFMKNGVVCDGPKGEAALTEWDIDGDILREVHVARPAAQEPETPKRRALRL